MNLKVFYYYYKYKNGNNEETFINSSNFFVSRITCLAKIRWVEGGWVKKWKNV